MDILTHTRIYTYIPSGHLPAPSQQKGDSNAYQFYINQGAAQNSIFNSDMDFFWQIRDFYEGFKLKYFLVTRLQFLHSSLVISATILVYH